MSFGEAEWFTPLQEMRNKQETCTKLQESGWSFPKIPQEPKISYFNNPLKYSWMEEYDRYFSYTKVFPLWDTRKRKCNSQIASDIQENIFEQEKNKPVPALTSLMYGRPCRPLIEQSETMYRKEKATADFYRRRGIMRIVEKKVGA